MEDEQCWPGLMWALSGIAHHVVEVEHSNLDLDRIQKPIFINIHVLKAPIRQRCRTWLLELAFSSFPPDDVGG